MSSDFGLPDLFELLSDRQDEQLLEVLNKDPVKAKIKNR